MWHQYLAKTFRFLIHKLTIIDITIQSTQNPFSVSETVQKLPLIFRSIWPDISSFSLRHPFLKTSFIIISIFQFFPPPSIFLEVQKISMVLSTFRYIDSVPLSSSFDPLTIITVSSFVSPDTFSMPMPILPVSDIVLSINPLKFSTSIFFSLVKFSSIEPWSCNFDPFNFGIVPK